MEAVILQSSQNQHISPYKSNVQKHNKKMINNNYSFVSRPAAENLYPSNNSNIHTGLLQTPNLFLSQYFLPQHQQSPFLHAAAYSNGGLTRGLSQSQPMFINNNSRKPSNSIRGTSKVSSLMNPRKLKASGNNNSPKKEEKLKKTSRVVATKAAETENVVISSTDSLGPDPKDLPMDVSKVLLSLSPTSSWLSSNNSISSVGNTSVFSSSSSSSCCCSVKEDHHQEQQIDRFSGSVVFTPSPPPSSLPLPTFSLRPKLSCNAEAAAAAAAGAGGVDAGATDNLRRLLRLQ